MASAGAARGWRHNVRAGGVRSQEFLDAYRHVRGLYDADFVEECRHKFHSAPSYLYRVLCDNSAPFDVFRQELDDIIAFAKKVGLLDDETGGRLRSLDDTQFLAAVSEVQAAKFFGDRGYALTPRPAGRQGRKGDFEIAMSPPVFTEVKAIFDRPREALHQRLSTKLWEYARRGLAGLDGQCIIDFGRMTPAADFQGPRFARWLRRFVTTVLTAGQAASGLYQDRSGFAVGVTVSPWPGWKGRAGLIGPWIGGFMPTQRQLSAAIDSALTQMPDDGRRNLAIIRPYLTFPPDAEDLDAAVGHVFGAPMNRRLSAVGLLAANLQRVGTTLSLLVYLNPAARYPIRPEELGQEGIVVSSHD